MIPDEHTVADHELVRETLDGSLEAFEELVRRHEKRVYGFLRKCCRNETDARELTQETFVKAYQALARFHARRSFAGWLFAIARNSAIDRFRAQPPTAVEPPESAPDEKDPAWLLQGTECGSAVWDWASAQLPETQFQALWLRYIEEMDVPEIARVLGKTRIHVKVILFRARQTLGRALRRLAGGGDLNAAWDKVLSRETVLRSEVPSRPLPTSPAVLPQGLPGANL